MKMTRQQGSVHVVLTVLLVVTILGFIGTVFVRNFSAQRQLAAESNTGDSNQNEQTLPTGSDLIERGVERCLEVSNLCLTLPSDWSENIVVHDNPNLDYNLDRGAIMNADGLKVLYITTNISGLGGTCEPDAEQKYTQNIFEVKQTREPSLYASKMISRDSAKGYLPLLFIDTNPNPRIEHDCGGHMVLFQMGNSMLANVSNYPWGDEDQENMKYYTSEDEAKRQFETADMQMAYDILLTTRYK